MSVPFRVVIVGGGISGLSTAFWLKRAGLDVRVLERASWAGGTMRTVRERGWLVETGPNSALETTPLFDEMVEALGIREQKLYADPSSDRRYIVRNGTLHVLPMSPGAFLGTRLWTIGGKIRLIAEPFIGRAEREESIAEFVTRRLGREFLDYAINPFVAGVYAGNPENLSVRAAFPKLYALEETYGGLVRGMVLGARERKKRAEKAKDRAKMFAFAGGMQTFPLALARDLGRAVTLGAAVTEVRPARTGGYTVRFKHRGRTSSIQADAVVISAPAHASADIVATIAPGLGPVLRAIDYPPVAEVFLGFRNSQVSRPLDGFGFLVPAVERRQILGTIWSSALFPGRAPEGNIALTTFVGGSRQPEILRNDDNMLKDIVRSELVSLMGISGLPVYAKVVRWSKAIPQYTRGYGRVIAALEETERQHPGLYFCSNFRGGIAVGDCLMSARKTADAIVHAAQQSAKNVRGVKRRNR
jgi:protoporphyrinogen/coproporphyrinogen III oxidase